MGENRALFSDQVAEIIRAVSHLSPEDLHALAAFWGGQEGAALSAGRLKRALSIPTADAAHLARSLDGIMASGALTVRDLQIVAETVASIRGNTAKRDEVVEIVCTAPERFGLPVRTTYSTAIQMIQQTRDQVVIVGYVFTEGASPLVELLAEVAHFGKNPSDFRPDCTPDST